MATLQGQANSSEISNRIYQNIRSITPNPRPRHTRPMSASTRLSFPGSSRLSAKSLKESQTATQEAYSDFDIIKNRSWSANRVRSSSIHLGKAGWQKSGDTPLHPPGGSASSTLIDPRPLLSPVSSPGTASPPVDGKGKQVSTRDLWNLRGSQVERLHQEWAAIEHCRTMKRASEMVQHRLDPMYRLSGSTIPLMARYHVNDTDMRRLREMTETNRILQLDLKRIVKHVVRKDQLDDKYPQTMAPQSSPYWSSSYSGIPATWGSYPESQQDWWTRDSLAKASSSYDASLESQSGIKTNWGLGWSDGESCSLSCFSKETLCDEERGRDVKERGEWKESQPAPNTEIETEIERMNRTETESRATSETKQTTTKRTKSAAEIEGQVNVEIGKRRAAAVAKTEDSLDRQESERREGHRQNASFEGSDPRPWAHDQHSPQASQRWISRHKEKNTQCQKDKKRTPLSVRLNFQKKGSPVSKKRAIKDIIEYYTISPPPGDPNPIRKKGGEEEEKPERLSKVAGTDVGHRQKNGPSMSKRQGLPWSDVDTWCSASINKGKASAEALLTPSVFPAAIGPSSLQQQLMMQHIQQLRQPPTSDHSSGQQAAQHGKTQTAEKEKGNRTVQKGCSPGPRLLSQNRITQPATRQKSDQQLHRQSNPERSPLPQAAVDQPAQRKQPSQQAAHLKSTSSPKPVARQGKYQQLSEWQKKRVQEIIQQFSQQPPNKRSGEEQRTAERQREKLHMTSYKRWLERKRRMGGKTCGSQTGASSVDSLEDTTVSYSSSDTLCCNRSGKAEPFAIDSANKLFSGHATQVTLLEEQKKKEEAAKREEEEGDSSDSNEDDYIYKILTSQRFKGGDEVNDSNKGETIPRRLTFKKKGFLCYDLASEARQTQWYNKIMEADNIHKLLQKGLKKSFEVSYRKFERQGTGLVRYLSGTHFHTVQVDRSSSLGDCIDVPVMKTFQLDKIPSNKQNPPKTSNKKKAAEKSQSVSSKNNLSKGRKGRLKENESVGDNDSSILDTSVTRRSEKQAAAEKGEVTQTSQSISQGSTDQTSVSRPETQRQPGDGMQSDGGEQERGRKGNVRQTGERSASQVSRRTSGRTSQAQAKDAKGTSAVRKSRAERHSACCNSQKNIIGISQSKRKDKKPKLPVKHITISRPVALCLEAVLHKTQGSTQSQSPRLTKEQEFQMSHLFEKKIGSVRISHSPSMVQCSKPRPTSAVSCSIPGKKQRMRVMMQGHQAVLEIRPSMSTPCLTGPSSKQLCSCPTGAGHSGCERGKDKPLTSSSCPNTGHQIQKHFQETASAGDVRSTTRGNCYRKPHGRKSAMSCPDVSARKKRLDAHSAPTAPTFYQKVPVRSVGLNQEGRSVSQRSVSAGWQDRCGGIAAPDMRVFSAQPLRGKQAKGRGQQKYQEQTGKYCKDHRRKGSHLHVDLNKMTFWRSQSGSKITISAPESDLSTECGRPCQVPVSSLPSAFEQQETFSSSVITVCSSHISKSKSVSTVTAEEQQCVTSVHTATAVGHNTRQPAPILDTKTPNWTQKVSQDETEKRSPVHTEKKSQSLNPQPNSLGEVQTPVCGEDGKLGATGITERQEMAGLRAAITQTWVQERGDMALARLGNLNKEQEQSNRQISARQPHPTLVLHITEAGRERGDNSSDMNLARSQQTVSSPRREVLELHLTMPDTQIICQTDSASSLHNCTKNISALDFNDASLAAKEDTGKKETVNSDSHSVSPKDVHVSNSLTGKKEEDSMITDMAPAQTGPEGTTKSSFSHYVPCMTSIISDGNGPTPCVSAPSDANSQMAKPGSQTEHTPGDHSTGQKGESRARADAEKVTTLTPITSVIVNYVLNWQQDNSGVMPTKLTAHSCGCRMTENCQHGSSGACRQLMHSSFCPSHVQGRTARRYSVPPMRRRKATASAGDGPQWKIATSAVSSGEVIEGMMDETSAVLSPTFETPGSRFTVPNNGAWGCCPPTWVWDRWAAQTSASMHSANREIAAKASRRVNINRTVKKDSPFAAANGDSSMRPPTPGVNSSGYCTERTRKGFLVKRIRKSPAHPPQPAEPVRKLAPTSQAVTLQSAARRYLEVVRPDLVCKTGGSGLTETSEDLDQSLAKCDLETCGLTAQTAVGSNCEIVREVLQENEPVQTEAPGDDAASMKGDPTPPLSTVPSLLTRKQVMSDTAGQQDISGLLHKRAKSAGLERAYIPVILPYKDYSLLSISQSTLTRRSSKEKVCDKEEQTPTQMLSSGKLDPCESPQTGVKPAVSVPVTSREAGEQQTPRHASKDRRCQSADLGHKDPQKPASSRRVQSADIKGRRARKSRRPRSKKRKGNKKVDDESSVEETDKTFLTPSCAASSGGDNPTYQSGPQSICSPQHTNTQSFRQPTVTPAHSKEKTPRGKPACAKRHRKPRAVFSSADCDRGIRDHLSNSLDQRRMSDTTQKEEETVETSAKMDTERSETDTAGKKYAQSCASSFRDNPTSQLGAQTTRSSQHTTTETSKQTPLPPARSRKKTPAKKHKKPATVFGHADDLEVKDHYMTRSKSKKTLGNPDEKKRTDIKTKKTVMVDARMNTNNSMFASSGRENPANRPKLHSISHFQHTTTETSKQPRPSSAHSQEKTPRERSVSAKRHNKPVTVFGSAGNHSMIRNNVKNPDTPEEKKRTDAMKTQEKTVKGATRMDAKNTKIDSAVKYTQSCALSGRDSSAVQPKVKTICSSQHTTMQTSKQSPLYPSYSKEKTPKKRAASAKRLEKPATPYGSAEATLGPNDHFMIRNDLKSPYSPQQKKRTDTIKTKEKTVMADTRMDTEIHSAVKRYTQSCALSGGDSPAVQPRTQSICSSHHTTVHISKLYPLSPARGQEKTPRERSASARRHNKPETVFGHADDRDVNNHSILRNKKTPDSPNGKKTINTFGKEAKPAKVDTRMDKDNTETPPRAVKKNTPRYASAGRNNPADQTQVQTICNFQHTSLESRNQSPLSSACSREKTPRERSASAKRHKKPGAVFGCAHDLDVNNHYVPRNKMTPDSPDEKKRTETIKTKDKTVLADSRMDTDNTETDFAVKKYTQSHASSGRDNPVVRSGAQTIRSSQHTTTETSKQTPLSSTHSREKMPRERSASAMKHKKPAAVFGSAEGNLDTRDHSVIRKNLKSQDSPDEKKRTDTIKTKEETIKGDSRVDTDNTETDTAVKKYTKSHASSGRDNPAVQPKVQTICGSQHTTAETSKQPPLTSAHSREKTPKERAASTKGHKKPAAVFGSARDHSVIRNNFKSPESPDEKKRSGIIKTKEKTIKNDTRLDTGITEIDNAVRKYTYAQSCASPDGDDPANQRGTQTIRSSQHTTTESSKQPCLSSACSQEKMPREKAASAKKNKKPVNVLGSAEDHSLIRNNVKTPDEKKRMDTIKRKEKSVEDDTWMDTDNTEIDTAVKKYTQSCTPSDGDSPAVQTEIQFICSSQQTAVQASKQSPPSSAREKTPRGSAKRHKKPTDAFGSEDGKLGTSDHPASRNKTTSHSLNRKERACSTKSQEKTEKIDPRIVDTHNTETENTGKKCTRQKKKARKRQAAPKKDSFEGRQKLINEYLELCLSPRDPSDKKVTARNCGKGRKMDLRKGDAVILKGWSTDPNLSLRERAQLHTLNNKPVKKDSIQHTAYEPSQGSTKEVSSFRSHLHPLTALGMRQKAMSSKSNLSHEPEIQAGQNLVSKGVFPKDDHFIGQLCHVGQLEGWVPAPMWQPPESDQPKEEGTGFRGKPHPHQGSTHSLESCHIYPSENCLANEDGKKFCPLSDQSDLQSITFSEVLAQYTEERSMGDQDSGWGQFLHRQKVPPPSPTSDVSQQTFGSGLWGGCSHHTDRDTHQVGEWSGGFHQGLAAEDDLWQPLDGKSGRRRVKSLLHRGHSAHVNRTGHGHVDDGCFDILKSLSDTTLTSTDKRNPTSPRARNSISMHEKLRHRHLSDSVSCARGNLHPQPGIDQNEMTGSDTMSTPDSVGQNGLARFTVSPIRNFNQEGTVACVCCTHMNEDLQGWGLLGRPGELKPAADSVGSEDVDTVQRRLTGREAGEEGHYHAPAGDIARNKNSFSPGLRLYEDRAGTIYSTASNLIPPLQLSENRDEAFHGTTSDFIPPLDLSESRYDTVRSTASDFIPRLQLPENRAGRNHSTASDSIPRLQLPENRADRNHSTASDSIPRLQLPENRADRNHSTASDSIPRLQLPENRDEATHYTTDDSCSTTAKHTKPCNHTGWQDPTMEMLGEVRDVFDAITQAKHHQGDSASGCCLSARNKAAFCQPPHSHRETGSGGEGTGERGERETWLSNIIVPCPVKTEQCDRPGTTNPDVFNLIEEGRFDDAEVFELFPKIRSYLKTENRPSGSKGKIGQHDTVRYFQRLILEPTFSRCKDHDHIGHPPSASQPGTPTVADRAPTEFPSYQPTADDQLKCRSARSVLSSHTISLRRKHPTQSARDRYSGDSVLGTEREVNRAAQSVLVMRPCKSCQPLSASPVTPEHKNRQTKSLLPKETVKKDVYRKQIHQGDMLKHTPLVCTSRFHDINNRLGPETLTCAPKRIQDKRRQIINMPRPQSAPSWRLSPPHMSVTGRSALPDETPSLWWCV